MLEVLRLGEDGKKGMRTLLRGEGVVVVAVAKLLSVSAVPTPTMLFDEEIMLFLLSLPMVETTAALTLARSTPSNKVKASW